MRIARARATPSPGQLTKLSRLRDAPSRRVAEPDCQRTSLHQYSTHEKAKWDTATARNSSQPEALPHLRPSRTGLNVAWFRNGGWRVTLCRSRLPNSRGPTWQRDSASGPRDYLKSATFRTSAHPGNKPPSRVEMDAATMHTRTKTPFFPIHWP